MAWTWEDIQRQWLGDGRVGYAPDEAVAAFNLVERTLGLEWMRTHNTAGGAAVTGSAPTASMVHMGRRLAYLEGLAHADDLVRRIQQNDVSAGTELTSIYLVRHNQPSVTV